jgi:predicted transcriptional regulator
MTNSISETQEKALAYMADARAFVHGPDLAHHLGTTSQGAVQTASSLVRRGLADKHRGGGRVGYAITPRGTEILAATRSLRLRS